MWRDAPGEAVERLKLDRSTNIGADLSGSRGCPIGYSCRSLTVAYFAYAAQTRPTSGNAPATQRRPSTTKALHAGPFRRALCRTRTGDPFLTMEVLYQLS